MKSHSAPLEHARIYAIGDIHGCANLLDRMVEEISRDLAERPCADSLTVTLGDYVDRGTDSRGVIDRLAGNPFPTALIALKGNHEEMLEAFLNQPDSAAEWRSYGGLETLHSYGIDVGPLMRGRDYERAAREFREALPQTHVDFLAALRPALEVGGYFLCHAGVRPGVPLSRQRPEDLLWIRDQFLGSKADFGKIVVHGHSPQETPEHLPNRINVDTGAFMTGRLTCAVLEPASVRFLSVG
jgi:serine/threonine protein phosphatase 1